MYAYDLFTFPIWLEIKNPRLLGMTASTIARIQDLNGLRKTGHV